MKRNLVLAIAASLTALVACDNGPEGTDAGVDSGMMGSDGGTDGGTDSGPGDDGGSDAGPESCDTAGCGTGEVCLRSVCIATCGADASGWDAALAADLAPVASFCRSASAFGTRISGSETDVFDMTTAVSSGGTSFTLSRWIADPTTSPIPSVVGMASALHPSDVSLFAGGYVAASPSGASVAFGYTLGDASFSGEVFEIVTAGGASLSIDATGNFDATWLDDDVVLVNGVGLEGATGTGQALYAADLSGALFRQVVTGLGSASGSVEIVGDSVLVGGFDDSFVGHVYVVARADIETAVGGGATVVVDSSDELLYDGSPLPSAFERVGDLFVTSRYDVAFSLEALQAHPIEAGPTLGAPTDLTTGAIFTAAYEAADDRMLLRFAEGLLLVE